jgi:DNA-binding CsgD family transcriptional regulator
VVQDPVDGKPINDVGQDLEGASALAALKWIDLIDLGEEPPCPAWRAPLLWLLGLGPLRPKVRRGGLVCAAAPRPVRVVRVEVSMDWFNELCRRTSSPAIAAELLQARANVDVKELVGKVRTPTLVIHAREDVVVPISTGRELAALIPGAEFVELDSKNHILLEGEPAWERFCSAVRDFMGIEQVEEGEEPAFASLTARERGILALLTEGLSNAEVAERLDLSEKTVRNHVSNLFDKLGVWTRAQAIVFARDRGFRT